MTRSALAWSAAALLAVLVIGSLYLGRGWLHSDAGIATPPFDPRDQPAQIAGRYEFVERHARLVSTIPCYCGCGASLGHQSLRDCYLRPGDSGYNDHAAICYVCLEEAADIESLLAAGKDAPSIREWIDREYSKFGPPTSTP